MPQNTITLSDEELLVVIYAIGEAVTTPRTLSQADVVDVLLTLRTKLCCHKVAAKLQELAPDGGI